MIFSIVTPCFNAERYIGETIQSILVQTALQSGRVALEYIVVDGQSQDRTVEIARAMMATFAHGTVKIISEPDKGMYDALAKGLQGTTGDICAYLNAGDLYSPHAFDVIADVLQTQSLQWFTGLQIVYNEAGQIVSAHRPFRYRSRLFAAGLYDNVALNHLQQESTFWHRELHRTLDFARLAQFKYAGDYFLWHQFARQTELKIIQAHLGGFRVHRGQLSEHRQAYHDEIRAIARQPHIADRLLAFSDKVMSHLPGRLWGQANRDAIVSFDHEAQAWRDGVNRSPM